MWYTRLLKAATPIIYIVSQAAFTLRGRVGSWDKYHKPSKAWNVYYPAPRINEHMKKQK